MRYLKSRRSPKIKESRKFRSVLFEKMDLFGGPFLIQKFEEGRDSDGGKKAEADSS